MVLSFQMKNDVAAISTFASQDLLFNPIDRPLKYSESSDFGSAVEEIGVVGDFPY